MTATVFTPLLNGRVVELAGGLWRKRLLPVGNVRYQDRVLKFSKDYLQSLAQAFREKAYDQVPLQLADSDNKHTNAVERFAGEVIDASADDDGLWITVRPTDRGEAILRENPKLGVSARIVEDYSRSDGQFYPAAVQHVLATHDPRIPGLGGWSVVEASSSADHVIDLSGSEWSGFDSEDLTPAELAEVDQVVAGIRADADRMERDELERWCASASLDDIERQARAEAGQPTVNGYGLSSTYDLSNDYGGTWPPRGPLTDAEREIARNLSDALAAEGDLAQSTLYLELANSGGSTSDGYGSALELANEQVTRTMHAEAARAAQARQRLPRGFDDRIQAACRRIADETYVPGRSLAFSSPDDPGKTTGLVTCGPNIGGYCMNSGHSADCGSLATTEMAEGLRDAGLYARYAGQPVLDADGKAWTTTGGEAATWADHLEALTGQRMSQNGFETGYGKPALTDIARLPVFGDYDDADDGDRISAPLPHSTLSIADRLREQMGEPARRSAAEAGLEKVAERMLMSSGRLQATPRHHPDHGESVRERRERMHRDVEPVPFGETWNGSLPAYTAGQL